METSFINSDITLNPDNNLSIVPKDIGDSDDSGFANIARNDNDNITVIPDIKFGEISDIEEELPKRRKNEKKILEKKLQREEYNKEREEQLLKQLKHLVTKSKFYSDVIIKQLSSDGNMNDDNKKNKRMNRKSKSSNEIASTSRDFITDAIRKELNTESDEERKYEGSANIELNYFHGELRDYQQIGLNWLVALNEKGINGILADEMGLGKKVQVIALLTYLIDKVQAGPFLIIASMSTIPNWVSEFQRFAPYISAFLLHGRSDERAPVLKAIKKRMAKINDYFIPPVVITTYECLMVDSRQLMCHDWRYIIVDEAQRIKDHECRLSQVLRKFKSINRLLLTGTPLQNNLSELWSFLNFLLPDILNDLDVFKLWLDSKDMQDADGTEKILEQEKDKHVIGALREILKPFMLRREKIDVCKKLPAVKEMIVN